MIDTRQHVITHCRRLAEETLCSEFQRTWLYLRARIYPAQATRASATSLRFRSNVERDLPSPVGSKTGITARRHTGWQDQTGQNRFLFKSKQSQRYYAELIGFDKSSKITRHFSYWSLPHLKNKGKVWKGPVAFTLSHHKAGPSTFKP